MRNNILSEGEWKLMKLLWKKAPRSIGELVEELREETSWSKTTVFVMLKRLVANGAVAVEESGRIHKYYPLLKQGEVIDGETDSFLLKVYDGSIGLMISSLVGRNALSEKEIEELRRVLDEAERKG